MAIAELDFIDDGSPTLIRANHEAPDAPLIFSNPDKVLEFSEVGIGMVCSPEQGTDLEFLVRMEVSLEYRGQIYALDYQDMVGAREMDSLNRNLTNEIVTDGGDIFDRAVMRAFRLPLKGGKSVVLTPGEDLRFHLKRFLNADAYRGDLEVFMTGELASEMQIITPRRVRMRRRDLFDT